MDNSGEHVQDVFTALYKYHLDNFLCDLVIITPSGSEVHAHSIVLSAVCFFCFYTVIQYKCHLFYPVNIATYTHTTILLLFWNLSMTIRVSRYQKGKTRKVKPIWIYWSKR